MLSREPGQFTKWSLVLLKQELRIYRYNCESQFGTRLTLLRSLSYIIFLLSHQVILIRSRFQSESSHRSDELQSDFTKSCFAINLNQSWLMRPESYGKWTSHHSNLSKITDNDGNGMIRFNLEGVGPSEVENLLLKFESFAEVGKFRWAFQLQPEFSQFILSNFILSSFISNFPI